MILAGLYSRLGAWKHQIEESKAMHLAEELGLSSVYITDMIICIWLSQHSFDTRALTNTQENQMEADCCLIHRIPQATHGTTQCMQFYSAVYVYTHTHKCLCRYTFMYVWMYAHRCISGFLIPQYSYILLILWYRDSLVDDLRMKWPNSVYAMSMGLGRAILCCACSPSPRSLK